MASEYLSTVVSHFRKDPTVAAVHTGHQLTSDQESHDLPATGTQTVPAYELYDALIEGGFFPPSSVSVRKSCLDLVGLFDENLQGLADWELWLRICRDYRFIGIPDVLIKYRIHAAGLSSNVQHMTEDRLKAVHKHFGPPEGEVSTWPTDKRRAYAFAYRTAAFEYSMQGKSDEAWRYMQHAAPLWPEILKRLDTFYEMACGDQPRGYRSHVGSLNIHENGVVLLGRLDELFATAEPEVEAMRCSAYGNAYLALAMLSDQAGHWGAARRYLLQAFKANPRFLASCPEVRRFLKLCAGQNLVGVIGNRRQAARHEMHSSAQG